MNGDMKMEPKEKIISKRLKQYKYDELYVNHEPNPVGHPNAVEISILMYFHQPKFLWSAIKKLLNKNINFEYSHLNFPGTMPEYRLRVSDLESNLTKRHGSLFRLFNEDKEFLIENVRRY